MMVVFPSSSIKPWAHTSYVVSSLIRMHTKGT